MTSTFIQYLLPLSLFCFSSFIFLSRNPVYGVLSFVVVVAHIVLLLIALELEFLAYTLAIVYIGAIVVLFLFVIMMFYIKEGTQRRSILRGTVEFWALGYLVAFLFSYYTFYFIYDYTDYASLISEKPLVNLISHMLFNDMALFTIIIGVLLFVGIIGAITLTIKEPVLAARIAPPKVRLSIKETLEKKL